MKKILSALLVFLMLFSTFAFVGCEYGKGRDNNKKTTEDDITDIVNDYIDKLDAEAFDNMQVTSNNEGHIEVFAFDAEESVGYCKEIYKDGTINQGWAKMRENGDAYLVADENGDRTALDLSTADYYEFLSGLRDSAYDYAREGISYLEFVLKITEVIKQKKKRMRGRWDQV